MWRQTQGLCLWNKIWFYSSNMWLFVQAPITIRFTDASCPPSFVKLVRSCNWALERHLCQLYYKTGECVAQNLPNNPRLHQQSNRWSLFSFRLFTILYLKKNKTTVFIWDAYNQLNAYWIYMVAVMYKMMFSK